MIIRHDRVRNFNAVDFHRLIEVGRFAFDGFNQGLWLRAPLLRALCCGCLAHKAFRWLPCSCLAGKD